jgi:branched-chain amino acid transport system permease protein
MEWWEVLVQQTINGLTRGAVFALIALGYTMVYGIIELINFAHGDVFMLGLFISLSGSPCSASRARSRAGSCHDPAARVHPDDAHDRGLNVDDRPVAYRPLRRSTPAGAAHHRDRRVVHAGELALLWKGPAPIAYPDVFPSVDILREWFGVDSAIFVTTKDVLVVGATIP